MLMLLFFEKKRLLMCVFISELVWVFCRLCVGFVLDVCLFYVGCDAGCMCCVMLVLFSLCVWFTVGVMLRLLGL